MLENNPFTYSLSTTPHMRIELRYVREYILANLPKHSKEARNDAIDNLDTRNHDSSNTEGQGKETIEIENAAIDAAIADR